MKYGLPVISLMIDGKVLRAACSLCGDLILIRGKNVDGDGMAEVHDAMRRHNVLRHGMSKGS